MDPSSRRKSFTMLFPTTLLQVVVYRGSAERRERSVDPATSTRYSSCRARLYVSLFWWVTHSILPDQAHVFIFHNNKAFVGPGLLKQWRRLSRAGCYPHRRPSACCQQKHGKLLRYVWVQSLKWEDGTF